MARQRNKAILFDYDRILLQEEFPPSLHCLSATTKMLLLSVLDPIGWTKRYIGDADNVKVEEWRDQAMVELILDSCGDELCALIAAAIRDCSDVQQALIDFAGTQGWSATTGNPDQMLPVDVREDNMLSDEYTCDEDHRYGMAVGIIQYIHNATNEVFQAIEVLTNPGELALEIADNLPFWELVGIGPEIIAWIQDSVYEAYQSAWSDPVADALACELFCKMAELGTCYLSFDTVFAVYLDPAFPSPPSVTDDALTWIQWLFDLELTTSILIVKLSSLMGLLAIRFGGGFGEMALGIRTFSTTVTLLEGDTNSDWAILCDECPEPGCELTVGFEIDQLPPVIILQGTETTNKPHAGLKSLEGEGYVSVPAGNPGKQCQYRIDLECFLSNVNFWVWVQHGNPNGVFAIEAILYDDQDLEVGVFAEFWVGARETWRQHDLLIGLYASYAKIRVDFSTGVVGDQSLFTDDFTLS